MSKIKNFSFTIPTVGRIAIGEMFENAKGQRLPRKLNHFTITMQHKRNGHWVNHPILEVVARETGQKPETLTEIPIAFMFNDPDLSVRERFEAFDSSGRMLCAGDGEDGRRVIDGKVAAVDCPGPDHCEFAKTARCKMMTRMNAQLNVTDSKGKVKVDPMSSFILRSSGFNTARTLYSKIHYYAAIFGGQLVGIPFKLKLRQKSSSQSRQSVFYYVDLELDCSMSDAMAFANDVAESQKQIGLDQSRFEETVRQGLANGAFEDTSEDFAEFEEYIGLSDGAGEIGLPGESGLDNAGVEGAGSDGDGTTDGLAALRQLAAS